ncbi:MAG: anti-sigma factor [Solirubrobacterales bacterium]
MNEASEQISAYLLGELDAEQAAAFERELASDPALREEVERLQPLVGRLEALPTDAWEPAEPPPLQMPPDLAAAAEPGPPAARRGRRGLRLPTLTLRPLPATGLATVLLAIGLVAGLLIEGGSSSEPAGAGLVLNRIDDGPAGASGDVAVAANDSRATLVVEGLDPSGADQFYEAWLLDADGKMIALGSFRVGEDGRAEVQVPIPVSPSRYAYFDVSLQEDNGDPTHSGVSVLRGSTS